MGESTDEIERQIRAKRSSLGRNLDELELRAKTLADWRTHYRQHTGLFLAAAFGAGAVVGTLVPTNRRQRSTSFEPARPEAARAASHELWSHNAARVKHSLGETWDRISDALLQVASDKAVDIVGQYVPGFKEHLGRR